MDWFSWLSKTGLEASLVYKYGLAFSQNELEREDIVSFNHEFLQSMGISIAKHRLEILKLARKERVPSPRTISGIIFAIKKTKKCLERYIRTLIRREKSAIVVVPRPSYSNRLRGVMLKRKKAMVLGKQEKLLLTNGGNDVIGIDRSSSPCDHQQMDGCGGDDDDDDGYWSTGVEEIIRWDTMFQDLNPT